MTAPTGLSKPHLKLMIPLSQLTHCVFDFSLQTRWIRKYTFNVALHCWWYLRRRCYGFGNRVVERLACELRCSHCRILHHNSLFSLNLRKVLLSMRSNLCRRSGRDAFCHFLPLPSKHLEPLKESFMFFRSPPTKRLPCLHLYRALSLRGGGSLGR